MPVTMPSECVRNTLLSACSKTTSGAAAALARANVASVSSPTQPEQSIEPLELCFSPSLYLTPAARAAWVASQMTSLAPAMTGISAVEIGARNLRATYPVVSDPDASTSHQLSSGVRPTNSTI